MREKEIMIIRLRNIDDAVRGLLVEGPPPTSAFPVSPETLRVMPCKPAPEIPVAVLVCFRLVCGAHEIKSDSRIRRCHPVFRLFGTIKALERRARTVLEVRELVHTAARRRPKTMSRFEMEAPAKHPLFILEERLPLELLKGKSLAD